jgi:DNA-binding transcriptional LysR family regulator
MFDWNDLRYVLSVARHGTLAAAARELGVNHSTVFRRIAAFEKALGSRLFDRLATGYSPTAAGEELLPRARRIEEEMSLLQGRMSCHDHQLCGNVRVTTSETLAMAVLTPLLGGFHRAYPGIRIDALIDNRFLSLARGEADVALRPKRPKENDLVGRQVGRIAWSIYGAPAYLAERPRPRRAEELGEHAFVGSDERLGQMEAARWLEEIAPQARVLYRSNSLINQMAAAQAGIGLVALPCVIADGAPGLVRLLPPIAAIEAELWLITHGELRHTARIRALMDYAAEWIAGVRRQLEGLALAPSAA